MTPQEIQEMAKELAEGQAIWYVLSACIGGAIAGLGTYLAEKGKNRATKEDIAAITAKVKDVEDVFNRGLADLNAHHQLRMVAAERRLDAHQKAFFQWQKIHTSIVAGRWKEALERSESAMEWFDSNCVFLTASTRSAFFNAVRAAVFHVSASDSLGSNTELYTKNLETIKGAGSIILRDVNLPELGAEFMPTRSDLNSTRQPPG